jgi:hypothetical protein
MADRKPRARKPRTQPAPVDPKTAALAIAAEIAQKRADDGAR